MSRENPYEYHTKKLGVQGRFLFRGRNAHPDSLGLISDRGLRTKIERGQIIRLRSQGPNTPMLVEFDSLAYLWQKAIIEKWGEAGRLYRESLFEQYYERDMVAFDFYSGHKFADETGLKVDKIDEYTLNASVLNTVGIVYNKRYKLRKELRGSIQGNSEVKSVWETISEECNEFKKISGHSLPETERRLREKYNKYKKEGYGSLIHKGHGTINSLKVDERHSELLNNVFGKMDHKPTYSEVSEIYEGFLSGYVEVINEETGEIYDPKEYTHLSSATVYNHLSKWENKIGTYLERSGDRQKYMSLFKPYHRLLQPQKASSIISVDDRQPVFTYDERGSRPWFYNAIDLGSEAFTCWVWGKDKKGIILDFYRQMVRNYADWNLALPAELEGEMNLNASFRDTFLKEGNMFQYVRIEANNARGKRIEQYYNPLRYKYEKKREGWLARPFALSEANQARSDKKIIIPYEDIIEGCLQDIQTWNNSEHSKIKGMSRWDVFLSMQNPNLRPTNYHAILPYLGMKTITSVRAGIVNFRRSKYLLGQDGIISTGDKLIHLMQQVEGRDITVFWLDNNAGGVLKAHIYINDRFVCEAIEQPGYNRARIEQTKEDLVNRELMSKYVNTIESYGRKKKNDLQKLTVIDNRPVTIGNSFEIPGLKRNVLSTDLATKLENVDEECKEQTIESKTFKKSLLNTF